MVPFVAVTNPIILLRQRLLLLLLCGLSLVVANAFAADILSPSENISTSENIFSSEKKLSSKNKLSEKNAVASDKVLDVSEMNQEPVSLTPYFSTLEDTSRALTFADVQSRTATNKFIADHPPADAFNFGFSGAAYWFRLHLSNTSNNSLVRLLEISNPELDHIAFYQQDAAGIYQPTVTGNCTPFATRPYISRHFVFPITLAPHSDPVIYLRIQANSALIPAKLWIPDALYAHEREAYLAQGWYFGMAIAMVLFNLFLFTMLRDSLYVLYSASVICLAVFVAEQHGLAKQYLWPDAILWSFIAFPSTATITLTSYLLFSRRFLNTADFLPRIDKLLKFSAYANLLIPITMTVAPPFLVGGLIPFAILEMMLCFGAILYCVKQRQRSGYYALAAFSMLIVGGVLTNLKTLAILPSNFFTTYAMEIGSAIEMMLLAFALADRFNVIRRKAVTDVQEANALLEVRLQEQKTELTYIHQLLRESEQSKLLSQERQRMTQDMHDGLGSSLVTALHSFERGKLDEQGVADVLRTCIDDLKLAIDSMEQVEADLLLLLATLRFRLAPRLEGAGIKLHWQIGDVPKLDWLTPSNALHILRILQESFTNIIKHAQATDISVATTTANGNILITVSNNGLAFDVAKALQKGGKGLQNQLRRAESIGGTVTWQSDKTRTQLCLSLPIIQA